MTKLFSSFPFKSFLAFNITFDISYILISDNLLFSLLLSFSFELFSSSLLLSVLNLISGLFLSI